MRGGTAPKFSPYFFPLSRSRLKIEKSTQYHGTVENREQRTVQNIPEKAASQFESCLRNHKTADFVRNQRFSFLKNSGNELLVRTSLPRCLTGRGIAAPEKMRMGTVPRPCSIFRAALAWERTLGDLLQSVEGSGMICKSGLDSGGAVAYNPVRNQ